MNTYRYSPFVWAPNAGRVELVTGNDRFSMKPQEHGYFVSDLELEPGTQYSFSLDGGPNRPDPRSQRQPEGVHGPSEVLDHSAFAWQSREFLQTPLQSAVLYELHLGTFTLGGTAESAIGRLDELQSLGITHISIMPVAGFSGRRGWGYDGVNLFAPHEAYGGPDGLKHLVDAAHLREIGVVMDVVYNHLGPEGNYLGEFGPYFTDRYRTPWGSAINLDDAGSDPVRRFLLDNARMWFEQYRIDGLRLDAVHALFDNSAVHFLEELSEETEALSGHLGRSLYLIAESDLNDPGVVTSRNQGGSGLHAQWSDDFHHALHSSLTGERHGYYTDYSGLPDLAEALRHVFVYARRYSGHRNRRHGRPATSVPTYHFLAYMQNHDQIGNRARGDRITESIGYRKHMIGATITLLSPFVPMLFQGEEWATSSRFPYFTDHQDPKLAESVRKGRRKEFSGFGWKTEDIPDPQAEDSFTSGVLDHDEKTKEPHHTVLEWYRQALRLRRDRIELGAGQTPVEDLETDTADGTVRFRRGSVLFIANLSGAGRIVPLLHSYHGRLMVLMASDPDVTLQEHAVKLPAESVVIFLIQD